MEEKSTNLDEEKDETYFSYFKAMEKCGLPKQFLSRLATVEEEERNDIYIYTTIRYPPKSTPPTTN